MIFEIIFACLILLLIFPIKVSFAVYLNLLDNRGANYVKFWDFIILSQSKFYIANGELTTQNYWNKQKVIELRQDDEEVIFAEIFTQTFLRKLILSKIDLYCLMGQKDDAFMTALSNAGINGVFNALISFLQTKKGNFNSKIKVFPLYSEDKLISVVNLNCFSNAFDLMFSIVKSKFKAKKRVMELRNGKR